MLWEMIMQPHHPVEASILYVGGPKKNRNFVIKNCVFIFRCYKFTLLQSTVHLMQCTSLNMFSTFRSSPETLSKWCLLMPLSFFSSPLPHPKNVFLWGLFSFGGIKRSCTERDRVNMAGGEAESCCFWLKIVAHSRLCALVHCRGEATTPHSDTTRGVFVSPPHANVSELVGKTPG